MSILDILLALGIAILVGIAGWLLSIAAVLLNGIVPIWIAAVIAGPAFVIALIIDVIVNVPPPEPEEPPQNGPPDIEVPEGF